MDMSKPAKSALLEEGDQAPESTLTEDLMLVTRSDQLVARIRCKFRRWNASSLFPVWSKWPVGFPKACNTETIWIRINKLIRRDADKAYLYIIREEGSIFAPQRLRF